MCLKGTWNLKSFHRSYLVHPLGWKVQSLIQTPVLLRSFNFPMRMSFLPLSLLPLWASECICFYPGFKSLRNVFNSTFKILSGYKAKKHGWILTINVLFILHCKIMKWSAWPLLLYWTCCQSRLPLRELCTGGSLYLRSSPNFFTSITALFKVILSNLCSK